MGYSLGGFNTMVLSRVGTLKKSFLIGLIIVIIIDIIGPYYYPLENYSGVFYFSICSVLFLFGMSCKKIVLKRKGAIERQLINEYRLTRSGENIIIVVSCISLICSIIYIVSVIKSTGFTGFAQGDQRGIVEENRNNLSRFTEAFMHMSAPAYIILEYVDNCISKRIRIVFIISFFSTPVAYLCVGARWSIYFYLILFYFIKRTNKRKKTRESLSVKRLVIIVISVIVLAYVLSIVFTLFQERGFETADNLYMISKGDMELRPFYKWLYETNPNFFNPIYKIAYYFGHSIPAFNKMYSLYDPSTPLLYGLYSMQVLQYVLIPFGYSTGYMKSVLASFPMHGVYMTYIHGYIVDFGLLFTPFFIFLSGLLFGKIEERNKSSIYCRVLYPIVLSMTFNAAIYDMWTIAMVDLDIFFVIVIVFAFKKMGIIYSKHCDEG